MTNQTGFLDSAELARDSEQAFIRWFADSTGRQKFNLIQSNFELMRNSRVCTQALPERLSPIIFKPIKMIILN